MPDHDPHAFLDRFAWHPEPALIGFRDEAASRAALRDLGMRTWEQALDYLYGVAVQRAMGDPASYEEVRRRFYAPSGGGPAALPGGPMRAEDLLAEWGERLAGGLMNSQHPRQFGYFTPPPLPMSIVGELLAQVANQGIDVWHAGPAAAFVEEEVVRWLCELIGYGEPAFGVLTSGGVMANFMAMTLARDLHLGRGLGLDGPPRGARLEGARVYTSDQSHFSVARALDELGFPPDTLVVLPADDDFRLRPVDVREAIDRDRRDGLVPFAIACVAGSTNTGSVDPVGALADLAEEHDLWLHVDAAYGGAVRLSSRDRDRVRDLERAHSVTVDPHKWFFQAYDIGGLLVRDGSMLAAVFGGRAPEYYRGGEARLAAERSAAAEAGAAASADTHGDQLNFYKLSFEGTRRWRALKLWLTWKHLGTAGFGRLIEANDDVAAHLARRIGDSDDFEALPAVPELSVVCFRHRPPGVQGEALDAHQDALQRALEVDGDGWLTTTRLRGATWLRAGIVNYLATEDDVDRLLATLRRLA